MPKHKIKRLEEISTENWQKILTLSSQIPYSNASKIPPFQHWLTAVLAIIWLTGKRINEILILKRRSIVLTDSEIKIRFHVGKKRNRGSPIELQPYQKSRTIQHKAVPYIQTYLAEYDLGNKSKEGYLFPATTQDRTRTVNTKFTNSKGELETRRYTYIDKGGHVFEENARYWLTQVNAQLPKDQRIYFHYGRHSIGIKLAYQGKSDIEIARILDETPRAALEYTKHAGGLGEEWTKEIE